MTPRSPAKKPLSSLDRRPGPAAHRSRPDFYAGRRYPLERLLERAARRGVDLGDVEIRVGNVLFHNDGDHLDAGRVAAILAAGGQDLPGTAVARALERLAALGIVQCITIEDDACERCFYDVELKPQLHVYDPRTGTLRDAESGAVIRATARNYS